MAQSPQPDDDDDLSPADAHALPPLLKAAQDGDAERLQRELLSFGDGGVNALAPGATHSTALHLAAYGGHMDCVAALLAAGAEKDVKNAAGKRAYDYAREQGHLRIAELLLTAPSVAAEQQKQKEEALLAEKAARLRLEESAAAAAEQERHNLALLHAARAGEVDKLRKALGVGGDANCHDRFGQSPLHLAAVSGKIECVQAMLEAGGAADAKNAMGHTPRDVALAKGFAKIAALLLTG